MHQLRGLFNRMQDSDTQAEEEPGQSQGWQRVRLVACSSHLPTFRPTTVAYPPSSCSDEPNDSATDGLPRRDPNDRFGFRPRQISVDGMPAAALSDSQAAQQASYNASQTQFMKPKFSRAPIKEAGRVAYLGESSNLSLLVQDKHGTTDVVHYPLPEHIKGSRARLTDLDNLEIDILHQRGAFLLPPKHLCDELVEAYFKWVAPVVPIINRSRFMRRYRDPKNPP